MKYTSPDVIVYITASTVHCSYSGVDTPGSSGGSSGGIQLPFIPG